MSRSPAPSPPSLPPPLGERSLASWWARARSSWRRPRAVLWGTLVVLLLVAQTLLVALTLRYEEARAQERSDEVAAAALGEIRRRSQMVLQGLQGLQHRPGEPHAWRRNAEALLAELREVGRIERRDASLKILESAESPFREPLFMRWPRAAMDSDIAQACGVARRAMSPMFSHSQFVPLSDGLGVEVLDLCAPIQETGQLIGFTVVSIVMPLLLDELRVVELGRSHELSIVEADGTRLARSGAVRGGGVFIADRIVDLPGTTLQLRVDAVQRAPSLIPNLATALVLGLSIGLFVVVLLLARDWRRRALAEGLLAEALVFRKAMEDSLVTGLRARDHDGRIVYVNPAFCNMVGYSAEELQHAGSPPYWPPYWPPEWAAEYQRRQAARQAPGVAAEPPHEGYETVFLRRNGERFPVVIYEAPLVDGNGRHKGWMSTVLDLSVQRRAEDLSRQQLERLQATARLASAGEMASLLSHELNQPLSAIASYATGSLNLIDAPGRAGSTQTHLTGDEALSTQLRYAFVRIAEQAERAGRVIKSVHDFVRRRHQAHEVIAADLLIESISPLVRLQARKSGARVVLDILQPAPRVKVDRTMVEQVLLNLARNAVQAMDGCTPLADRMLTLRVRLVSGAQGRWVVFSVIDAGPGIAAEVASRLFTPFFTTKDEGMGLGLSLCRTVVEQHGGAMDFDNLPAKSGQAGPAGAEFRFTLPLSLPRGPTRVGPIESA